MCRECTGDMLYFAQAKVLRSGLLSGRIRQHVHLKCRIDQCTCEGLVEKFVGGAALSSFCLAHIRVRRMPNFAHLLDLQHMSVCTSLITIHTTPE